MGAGHSLSAPSMLLPLTLPLPLSLSVQLSFPHTLLVHTHAGPARLLLCLCRQQAMAGVELPTQVWRG